VTVVYRAAREVSTQDVDVDRGIERRKLAEWSREEKQKGADPFAGLPLFLVEAVREAGKERKNRETVLKGSHWPPEPGRQSPWNLATGKSGSDAGNSHRNLGTRLATATARACAAPAAALAGLIAIPAKDRAIATRLKRHCCRLSATRTNHRCSLCWSRTVAGAPLVVFLCLTAILATLWGRVTAFLEERLISSGEGKVLPAIAALKCNISGHGSPLGACTMQFVISVHGIF